MTEQLTTVRPEDGDSREDERSRGRPPIRWSGDIKRKLSNWMNIAPDRKIWKKLEEAFVQQWTRNDRGMIVIVRKESFINEGKLQGMQTKLLFSIK